MLVLSAAAHLYAAEPLQRYAVILNDPPAAEQYRGYTIRSAPAQTYRQQVRARQVTLEQELNRRNFRVTGAVQTVLNAVFVSAPASRLNELRAMPGVKAVTPLRRFQLHLNRAVGLENVPAAWNALGGTGHAGAGVKIGIIDTGIDQNHAAFQDSSLQPPQGFPICTQGLSQSQTCTGFTNNKVIVARSYVAELASGSMNQDGVPRPDDISPRDHIGHGTALGMITAGETNTGPTGISITGLAPKAWLGSYKVFGSGGVNDFTGGDVLISAIEAALNDGMDVAVLSLGSTAFYGPLDTGSACGSPAGTPCDAEAQAAENAVNAGMLIASSAGNDGDSGQNPPTLNTINSPADAPSVLAAGASTNSHQFVDGVSVQGFGRIIAAVFGDGPLPPAPLTAPLVDVTKFDSSGLACNALPPNSLSGAIVIITRGSCDFVVKVGNAENAGAFGVLFVDNTNEDLFPPGGLIGTNTPAALISLADGAALRTFVSAHSGVEGTLGNTLAEVDAPAFNTVASFSSRGPSITYALKPEALGVGDPVYMATQKYDSNGEMYDASGYIAVSGTSFSAPMMAGAAALVKQKNPGFNALQLKSAVVNAAQQNITDNGQQASVLAAGNGLLDAGTAVSANITVNPTTISFGAIGQTTTLPSTQTLTIHNSGNSSAALTLGILGNSPPSLSQTSLTVGGGQDQQVKLTLAGSPSPGIYQGALLIHGGATTVRVPYLYLVGDGVPADLVPLAGDAFDGPAGQPILDGLGIKVIDQYGVAVPNSPVQFSAGSSAGAITNADTKTDQYGMAFANATAGPAGRQSFFVDAGGMTHRFSGVARDTPTIFSNGAVSAASFKVGPGIVPGSYIAIFGSALSDTTQGALAQPLPLGISETSVSFEVPSAGLSLPGRMLYADSGQVNVQVPWELAGQTSVQMRVNVGLTSGAVYTAPVAQFNPAVYVVNQQNDAAALDENFKLITSSNPAKRGHTIQIYMNGLGPVDHPPATGEPVPPSAIVKTLNPVTVTIGGRGGTVQFSGLTPTLPGLNQVNVVVPQDAPTGSQQVVVSIGGVSSPAVNLYVQ